MLRDVIFNEEMNYVLGVLYLIKVQQLLDAPDEEGALSHEGNDWLSTSLQANELFLDGWYDVQVTVC